MASLVITNAKQLEVVQGEAVSFLLDVGEVEVGLRLARVRVVELFETVHPTAEILLRSVTLSGAPQTIDELRDLASRPDNILEIAFLHTIKSVETDPENVTFEWQIAEMPVTRRLQGVLYPGPGEFDYNGLSFRSRTEVVIAQALDEASVLYFPLPVAVRGRTKLEPDFVVVHLGRVGVLEVDGPHHTALTRAREDLRAAWFLKSGVRLVRHYSVHQIDADAVSVVRDFLTDLRGPTL